MQNYLVHTGLQKPGYNSKLNQGRKKTWGPLENDKTNPNSPLWLARQYIMTEKRPNKITHPTIYRIPYCITTQYIPSADGRIWLCLGILTGFLAFFDRNSVGGEMLTKNLQTGGR
jgi:hypothetical protein